MAIDDKSDGIGIVDIKWNGESIVHAVNSPVLKLGGAPYSSRSATGGGEIIPVHTKNGEDALASLTFDVPTTVYGVDLASRIKAYEDASTFEITYGDGVNISIQNATSQTNPDINFSSDGVISFEFMGAPVDA